MAKSLALILGLALLTWLGLGRGDWPRAFISTLSGSPEGGTEMKVFLAVCAVGVVLALLALARDQTDKPPGTPSFGSAGLALVWASVVAGAVLGAGTQPPLSFGGFLFGAVGGFFVGIPLYLALESFSLGVFMLCALPGLMLWGALAEALPFVQHLGVTGMVGCMVVSAGIGALLASRLEDKMELYQVPVARALVGTAAGLLLGLIGTLTKTLVQ